MLQKPSDPSRCVGVKSAFHYDRLRLTRAYTNIHINAKRDDADVIDLCIWLPGQGRNGHRWQVRLRLDQTRAGKAQNSAANFRLAMSFGATGHAGHVV